MTHRNRLTSPLMSPAQLAQPRARVPWWTTRPAALCSALAVLFAALVVCLGYPAHGGDSDSSAAMTNISGAHLPTGNPTGRHGVPAAHPGDCPAGGTCCAPAAHDVPVILAAPSHTPPVLLPRTPDLPLPSHTPAFLAHAPPAGTAPDLHVLQVQRT